MQLLNGIGWKKLAAQKHYNIKIITKYGLQKKNTNQSQTCWLAHQLRKQQ